MGRNTNPAILLFICFLLTQRVFSQLQENLPDDLVQSFLRYTKDVPREEMYVHTDREAYAAGENLWFSVYLIDRQSFKPSLYSSIAYVELLNPENRPVVQKRILINEGSGPGQIVLPDTLSTGTYTIRAYTSWMKNFLPDNCFVKDIHVYHAINSNAYKAKVSADRVPGMGTGKIEGEGNRIKAITLKADNSGPDFLEMEVITQPAYRSPGNEIFYIFIQTRGNINHVSAERTTGDTTRLLVQKTLLDEGINQITLFNATGMPVVERYVYTPVRANDLFLRTIDSCKQRNKITLDLAPRREAAADFSSASLSISIAPRDIAGEFMDMNDYFLLGTEYGLLPIQLMKGRAIDKLTPESMDSLLMHVSSHWIDWEKIRSWDGPGFRYPAEKKEHFMLGKLLTVDQQAAGAGEVLLLCRPGKAAGFQYTETDMDGNFNFRIPLDEGLNDLIIMPEDAEKKFNIIMESSFSDRYFQSRSSVDPSQGPVPAYIAKMSVNHQVKRIYGISGFGSPLDPVFPPLKQKRFYGKPDYELVLADFISLPLMEEVFFELLPYVSLKKKNTGYEIKIADRVDNAPYITSPCLMIDGVITRDASTIANLDPETVEKIDVIKEKYIVGKYAFSGIVNVITKAGDYSCIALPDYMIRLSYRVTDPVWNFVSPDYSSGAMQTSRIPDYRNTLYWSPAVRPEKGGTAHIECWSSDNSSDYSIHIQGITKEGKLISERKEFKVY